MSHLYMHELLKLFDPSLLKAAFLSAWWFSRCSRSAVQNQSSGVTTLGGLGLAIPSAWWFSRGSRSAVQNQSSGVTTLWMAGLEAAPHSALWFRGSRSAVQTQSPCVATLGGLGLSGYFWPVENFFFSGTGSSTGGELCCVERALW